MSPTLPPGQIETKRFPMVGERSPSNELSDPRLWRLEVVGLVRHPLSLDLDTFLSRADRDLLFDIHCVTSWTRFGARWTGLPLKDVLEEAEPSEGPDSFPSRPTRIGVITPHCRSLWPATTAGSSMPSRESPSRSGMEARSGW